MPEFYSDERSEVLQRLKHHFNAPNNFKVLLSYSYIYYEDKWGYFQLMRVGLSSDSLH